MKLFHTHRWRLRNWSPYTVAGGIGGYQYGEVCDCGITRTVEFGFYRTQPYDVLQLERDHPDGVVEA